MDKLKPIMKYYFWGLFVLALLIPTLGWWSGASGYVAQITEQQGKIDGAYKAIPASAESKPNPSWVEELNKLIPDQEKRNKESAEFLWTQQKKNFFWPGPIQSHLPVKHRGEFSPIACDLYRNEYRAQHEYVWRSCDPLDPATNKGTLLLSPSLIPNRAWPLIPPVSKEIWEVQEDLWLLKAMMDVFKQMNAGSSNVNESPLRMVSSLVLTGGDGTKIPTGTYAATTGENGDSSGGEQSNYAAPTGGTSNFSFSYESELGGGGDGKKLSGGGEYTALAPDDSGGEGGTPVGPGMRYVGAQEGDVLSLQRGFYIEVVIDHRRIPEFIGTLTNCAFPVKINRYQFSIRNNLNPLAPRKLAAPNPFARKGAFPGVTEIPRTSSESALSASYLANLAVCGQMAIFTPPPHMPEATGEVPLDPNAKPAEATAAPAESTTPAASTTPTEMPADTKNSETPALPDPPAMNPDNGAPEAPIKQENKNEENKTTQTPAETPVTNEPPKSGDSTP